MRPTVKRFQDKQTYGSRSVKRTTVNASGENRKRPERDARSKRSVRSY